MPKEDRNLLPHDGNAEYAVIAAMMIDSQAIDTAMSILNEHDFYLSKIRIMFNSIVKMHNGDKEVDPISLRDEMKVTDDLDRIGGFQFINEVSDFVMSTSHIKVHANIIKKHSISRSLIQMSNRVRERLSNNEDPEEVRLYMETELYELERNSNEKKIDHVSVSMQETLSNIEYAQKNRGQVTGVASGLKDLDDIIGGFQRGLMYLFAARPGMGKTALMVQMILNMARNGKKVLVFSLEMPSNQLNIRMLANLTGIDSRKIEKGFLTQEEILSVAEAAEEISSLPIFICDESEISVAEVKRMYRKKRTEGFYADMIFIDYLQIMEADKFYKERKDEVSAISRGITKLAKSYGVPIVAFSQLNRKTEDRSDKRPMLSDLRESGTIEQDAYAVTLMYRDEYYNKDTQRPGIVELNTAKNRGGPTGMIEAIFIPECSQFRSLAVGY